jgi:DNA topoisomerase-2
MNTPILKARKGNKELVFYNNGEYEAWLEASNNQDMSWNIKYYKGLGTSTGKEFREYFEKKKIVGFQHTGAESDDAIDMVFNKKRADDRKDWLGEYDRGSYLDTAEENVSYTDFINKELIHFSKYDCDRSIPNLMDGLKISLRKILYSAFKKNLHSEIKVAQFTGYVSEHSGYHHGEASLNAAIVGMAQNFVGSNNINLLVPSGQFGTRLQGGKDSASERYIFTFLNNITRAIFPAVDDNILKYLDDDGQIVEPLFYAPIVPMVLVNGTKGIGTGFSTDIMCYNPLNIIDYLKAKLLNNLEATSCADFIPYYEGFQGTISRISESSAGSSKYLIKGKYETIGADKIRVTELPVGLWTDDFKVHLESLTETSDASGKKVVPIIKDFDDMCKDTSVDFTIQLNKGVLAELSSAATDNGCNALEKTLKLYTTGSSSNMHLFDANDKLKKYANVTDIIDDYYTTRLELYEMRKTYLMKAISQDVSLLSNKAKYIQEVINDTIDLRKKTKDQVHEMLLKKGYDQLGKEADFKYLTKMAMDSVTEENVAKLLKEHGDKVAELEKIQSTTIQTMWLTELETLRSAYIQYTEERQRLMTGVAKEKVKKVVVKPKVKVTKTLLVSDD